MSAIREALGWVGTGYAVASDPALRDAALAEVGAMERVVEAADALMSARWEDDYERYALREALAALAELDGQTRACCGDPGDCGETCA